MKNMKEKKDHINQQQKKKEIIEKDLEKVKKNHQVNMKKLNMSMKMVKRKK